MWTDLPLDIVHRILSYNETLILRNGIYMGKIPKTDKRYKLLRKINRKFSHVCKYTYYMLTVHHRLTIIIWDDFCNGRLKYQYFFKNNKETQYICYAPK